MHIRYGYDKKNILYSESTNGKGPVDLLRLYRAGRITIYSSIDDYVCYGCPILAWLTPEQYNNIEQYLNGPKILQACEQNYGVIVTDTNEVLIID